MRYKISILEFNGEGECLKAQSLYEQTVKGLDVKAVIDAVNYWVPTTVPAKRAPRSDKGKKRVEDIVPE